MSNGTLYNSEGVEYINFPNHSTWNSVALTEIRERFLNYIDEKRTDVDSYRKYLFIALKASEVFRISNGFDQVLLRKNIPSWVLNDIKEGRRVRAMIYVKWDGPKYFKYKEDGTSISLLRKNPSRFGRLTDVFIINDTICGTFDIKNIITSEVNRNGDYDKNVVEISKKTCQSIDEVEKQGKIKPLHLLEIENFALFPFYVYPAILMTRFNVHKIDDEYKLTPLQICSNRGIKNTTTVWV